MATNFPSSVDSFTNPTTSDTLASVPHASQHADVNDAVEALQTKVGIDGSADTSSLEYRVTNGISDGLTVDTDTLVVDSTNNRVGIGTTTPSTTLHAAGSILSDESVTIGSGGEYVAGSIYSDANWGMIFRAKQASPAAAEFRLANSADTERLRIDNSGNVGINDTTPSYKLDVNGDINATGAVLMGGDALNLTTALAGTYQSLSSGSSHPIDYSGPGSVVVSNSAGWWSASDPTRITVDRSGVFLITAAAQIGYTGSTNFFSFAIFKNGNVIADIVIDSSYYPGQSLSIVDSATSGTDYRFHIYHQTGSTLNLWAGRNFFGVTLLRS